MMRAKMHDADNNTVPVIVRDADNKTQQLRTIPITRHDASDHGRCQQQSRMTAAMDYAVDTRCQSQYAVPGTAGDASKIMRFQATSGAFDTFHNSTNFSHIAQCLQQTVPTTTRDTGPPAITHDCQQQCAIAITTRDGSNKMR